MNKVVIEPTFNRVEVQPLVNKVEVEAIRIHTDYNFIAYHQTTPEHKEV